MSNEGEFETLRVQDLQADARALDVQSFTEKHGAGFLLHLGRASLQSPEGPQHTVAIESRTGSGRVVTVTGYRVWRIRKTERSLAARFVSVGRTRNNDVVISDVSLSKFHAFFVTEGGVMKLQDARSRNGTFVNGVPVSAQGKGPPTTLRSGARVRFGAVDTTYLDPSSFHTLLLDLTSGED